LQLPDHAAFARLMIEVDNVDVSHDPALARQVTKQLEVYNIGISISDVVRDIGFDFAQGFMFAKPMDAARFLRTVLQRQARSS
jgi:EAL domain-containing protein (putative c-di-GMP-specific phosphodiesterase class I)